MTIYLILFAASLVLLLIKNKWITQYAGNALLIIMACMCMFRGENVGLDTWNYKDIFEVEHRLAYYAIKDPLYGWIGYFFLGTTGDYRYFQITIGLITFLPLFYLFNKKSENFAVSLFIFIFATNRYFFETFNAERQCAATSLLLMCWVLLEKKRYIWALVFFLLAVGMHHTSFIYLPIVLITYLIKLPYRIVAISSIISLVFTLFFSNMSLLVGIQKEIFSDEFIGKFDTYAANLERTTWGLLPVVIPYTVITLVYYNKLEKYVLFRLFAYGTIFANFISVLPVAYRISYGVIAVEPLIYPMLLKVKKYRDVAIMIMIFLFVYGMFSFFSSCEKAKIVPYYMFNLNLF